MKQKISFIFFLMSFISFSQKTEFLGIIKTIDSNLITYKISIEQNTKNDSIHGYSISDIGGPYETKSLIKGVFNRKTLSFKEYKTLYTKAKFNDLDFCYIDFKQKLKKLDDKTTIKGSFQGFFDDNSPCFDGNLTLKSISYINKKKEKIISKIQKSKRIQKILKKNNLPTKNLNPNGLNIIKKGQNTGVFFDSENLVIEVWDNGQIDNDVINLYINSKKKLRNFSLIEHKEIIRYKLTKKTTILEIESVSEGETKKTTSSIRLIDGEKSHEILTSLNKGEKTTITIINNNL